MDGGYIAVVVILTLLLVLFIAAFIVFYLFIYRKLKQQIDRITELEEHLPEVKEKSKYRRSKTNTKKDRSKSNSNDSAVDISEILCEGNNELHDLSPDKPRYSVSVRKEVQKVYGESSIVSHLYQLTQDSCNEASEDKTKDIVPVDEIKIKPTNPAKEDFVSRSIKRKSVWDGRPTSFVTSSLKHKKSVFVHKDVGKDGGELDISGVILRIPKGALLETKRITLGITWCTDIQPNLSENQAHLSPIIVCQPCIKFQTPVKLSFPHCAENIEKDWKWKIWKRQSDIFEQAEWTDITLEDYDERAVTSSRVMLNLFHFTLYTLIGEPQEERNASKVVRLMAFTSLLQTCSLYKINIYCVNEYGIENKNEKGAERNSKRRLDDSSEAISIKNNGENIVTSLCQLSDGWRLKGQNKQEFDIQAVWHGRSPNCTFTFEPVKDGTRKIMCEYESNQISSSEQKAKLKITDELPKLTLKTLEPIEDDCVEELRRKLLIQLDPDKEDGVETDWQSSARKTGLNSQEIQILETTITIAPIELVILCSETKTFTLEKLRKGLLDINSEEVNHGFATME